MTPLSDLPQILCKHFNRQFSYQESQSNSDDLEWFAIDPSTALLLTLCAISTASASEPSKLLPEVAFEFQGLFKSISWINKRPKHRSTPLIVQFRVKRLNFNTNHFCFLLDRKTSSTTYQFELCWTGNISKKLRFAVISENVTWAWNSSEVKQKFYDFVDRKKSLAMKTDQCEGRVWIFTDPNL